MKYKWSQTWLEGEKRVSTSWSVREQTANNHSHHQGASSKQCMDSQIWTGNFLIPLAQFLCGSHIAKDRDISYLISDISDVM